MATYDRSAAGGEECPDRHASSNSDVARIAEAIPAYRHPITDVLKPVSSNPWGIAALSFIDGYFNEAADHYDAIGALTDANHARLRAGEQLLRAGQREDGERAITCAVEFWREAGATGYLREAEALLSREATG